MAIGNAIAVANGKGGVLKSTTASHVAGIAADSGWKVLVVDADSQGNTSRDLGYVPDGGVALAEALLGRAPLVPVTSEHRPNLDYVPGGEALVGAAQELGNRLATADFSAIQAFSRALAPIAGDYNLILVDTGPGDHVLRKVVLAATRYVVVPCKTDQSSIPDGLANLLRSVSELRDQLNPELEILGILLGPVRATETRRLARARAHAAEVLGSEEILFDHSIRDNGKIADDCRELGIIATEYEARALEAQKSKTPWYKIPKADRAKARLQFEFSKPDAAAGLASDWTDLTDELLGRFSERQAETSAA